MKRLLLAAADRDLLEIYRQILGSRFGEAVTAFDGTQVVALLETEPVDLVILDRRLPRMEYESLAARIGGKGIPLLLLTAGPADLPAAERGSSTCLSYPFTPEEICEAAAGMLGENPEPEKDRSAREPQVVKGDRNDG